MYGKEKYVAVQCCDIFLFVFLKKGNDNYLAIQLRFGFFRCLRS